MGWAKRDHQVCLAHLFHDVQYAIEAAPGLKGLLKRACAIGRRRECLADATLKTYEADLDRRLDRLMALIPSRPAGTKLQTVIKKIRRYLFAFVTNRDISATNNGSERALRPCAVYRKITNGFRSEWGAALYAYIRSAVETARRRSISAIDRHPPHPRRAAPADRHIDLAGAVPLPRAMASAKQGGGVRHANVRRRQDGKIVTRTSVPKSGASMNIITLKMTLRGLKPPMTLGDLHEAIQAAMGWHNCHLHAFDVGGEQFRNRHSVDDVADENRVSLNGLLGSPVVRFVYIYDFGDNWQHTMAFEKASRRSSGELIRSVSRISAIVRRKIATASGVIRNCWPSWRSQPSPNASKSSATSSIRTNSPLTSQMPHSPLGSG
ncbi:Transposase IS66 family protein [Mesorhizobium sp. NFR06]|uniref:IS1096 element passenger TnpR family protein n=1 Tax=Mesorhizobium sp. NFR06 TaxID=1566290 RepID=UPI0008F020E9|nr:Transposase IS66 family protein [Mesorhizobium sp. NFR06]